MRLDEDSIDAIAQRLAAILRSESLPTPEQLITAIDAAAWFTVSRTCVHDNAERLGAIRLGTGSKARLRFDPMRVRDLIQVEPNTRERPALRLRRGRRMHEDRSGRETDAQQRPARAALTARIEPDHRRRQAPRAAQRDLARRRA